MFLQESDVFMDAMLAANTKKPKQRKRKGSISKDSPTDAKKDSGSPNTSPRNEEVSPSSIKPTFKFYQDTLESSMEEDKDESSKNETDSMEFAEPSEDMSSSPVQERVSFNQGNESLKGVLVYVKSKKQKKSVTWKEDNLEAVQYFELDETERVNVTKNFADMKSMEREMESQNINILARKLAVDDVMEERTRWMALIPIDTAPVTAPGKNSQEKEIQYAREKTVVAALYYTKRSIPDSPSEPDLEIHATTDPVSIPLEDVTGTTEVNDFTKTPWPEPRGQPPPPTGPPPAPAPAGPPLPVPPPQFVMGPGGPGPGYGPSGPPFPPMGPFMPAPGMPPPGMPGPGDVWRTADGKVVPITPDMFPPGMMAPGMGPPMGPPGPMMLPPGVTPEMAFHQMGMGPVPVAGPGPNPSPEGMPQFGGFGPMGPAPPGMGPPIGSFGPPPPGAQVPPQGPVPQGGWQGAGPGAGGSWYHDEDKGPGEGSRRGGYQGGNWRGGGGRGRDARDPDNHWNTSNPRIMPVCNNYKRGSCKMGSRCRFRHPSRSDH